MSLVSHCALTRTKLAGNHPSSSSIWPHHQSLLEASSTLMTSPALNASSRSAMVTWSHTASALTIEPPLINWRKETRDILCNILIVYTSNESEVILLQCYLSLCGKPTQKNNSCTAHPLSEAHWHLKNYKCDCNTLAQHNTTKM